MSFSSPYVVVYVRNIFVMMMLMIMLMTIFTVFMKSVLYINFCRYSVLRVFLMIIILTII